MAFRFHFVNQKQRGIVAKSIFPRTGNYERNVNRMQTGKIMSRGMENEGGLEVEITWMDQLHGAELLQRRFDRRR